MNEPRNIAGVIADTFATRASPSTAPSLHRKHGAALFVGVDAELVVRRPGRAPIRGRAVMLPPDLLHSAECPGPTLGLLFDPERLGAVARFSRSRGDGFALDGRRALHLFELIRAHRAALLTPDVLDGITRETALVLGRDLPPPKLDARVERALERLRCADSSVAEAIADSPLSPAHLRALFARDVGLSMRTYRLWRRLLAGVDAVTRMDATTAAHQAGFADLAHFSRTCKRMLGYSPTVLRHG